MRVESCIRQRTRVQHIVAAAGHESDAEGLAGLSAVAGALQVALRSRNPSLGGVGPVSPRLALAVKTAPHRARFWLVSGYVLRV
jgi:hypothetical protein